MIAHRWFLLISFSACIWILSGCESEKTRNDSLRRIKGEYIYRLDHEHFFTSQPLKPHTVAPYPWEKASGERFATITKEHFRCRGNTMNPIKKGEKENGTYCDCGGSERHSLPLRDGKEFIYPILIDLLNYLQDVTNKRVVITAGHRCPEHQEYVDSTPRGKSSKHQIGAEVRFYIEGLENSNEKIVDLLKSYYQTNEKYKNQKDYVEFQRYQKDDMDVSTPPWYNKEIFIKYYKSSEGRDFDHTHTHPYYSIQVRYDYDLKEKVVVSWNAAHRNYLRK